MDKIFHYFTFIVIGFTIGILCSPYTAAYQEVRDQRDKLSDAIRMSMDNDTTVQSYLDTVGIGEKQLLEWSYCY